MKRISFLCILLIMALVCSCGAVRADNAQFFMLRMEGESMTDTLQAGDLLLTEYRSAAEMKRFDLVAVKYPGKGDTLFVKRLIGLPGDTVELKDGYLYLNGEKYDEPYINDEYRVGPRNKFGPETVPADSYFVMGDHRNNSNDSRYSGPLPAEMMIGVITQINEQDYVNIYAGGEESSGPVINGSLADNGAVLTGVHWDDSLESVQERYGEGKVITRGRYIATLSYDSKYGQDDAAYTFHFVNNRLEKIDLSVFDPEHADTMAAGYIDAFTREYGTPVRLAARNTDNTAPAEEIEGSTYFWVRDNCGIYMIPGSGVVYITLCPLSNNA